MERVTGIAGATAVPDAYEGHVCGRRGECEHEDVGEGEDDRHGDEDGGELGGEGSRHGDGRRWMIRRSVSGR